jgi:copper(I)-binding protein
MRYLAALTLALLVPLCAQAQLTVREPWAHVTVPGQKAAGVFMTLETTTPLTLVGIRSPAAKIAELHTTSLEKDVMKMRPVARLPLKAGEVTELKPGAYHIMLMDLKTQLVAGQLLKLTLIVENEQGKEQEYEVEATVLPLKNAQAH